VHTLVSACDVEEVVKVAAGGDATQPAGASAVGKVVAERAKAAGITSVVFDRGGFLYHGRVKAVADSAREAGLDF
ncbi:MAG: 50S ribosomal protein L18, partial [Chloroflexota bacterium]